MTPSSLHNVRGNETDSSDKARRRLIAVWTWVGAILLIAVGIYLAKIISVAVGIVAWTVVFVFILVEPVDWLEKHGVRRGLGTTIAYILLAAVISFIVWLVFAPGIGISAQFDELINKLPAYTAALQDWMNGLYDHYSVFFQSDDVQRWISGFAASISDWLKSLAATSATSVIEAGTSLMNTVVCIGFALVVAFWILMDLPRFIREIRRIAPPARIDDVDMLQLTFTRVMGGYLKAVIIQCAIIGVACGIMFAILGVPSPAALGAITGLLNIIPIIGPWFGGALAFVVCIIESPLMGIIALIGTVVIQQFVYTFVSPKIMGDSVDIHPALTFIALMGGAGVGTALGGLTGSLVGALLSIPLVAFAKSLFVYYFEKRTGRRIVSEEGVFFKGVAVEEGEKINPLADATAPMPPVSPSATGSFANLTGRLPKIELDNDEKPAHKK